MALTEEPEGAVEPLRRLKELTETLVGPELFGRILEALPDALVVSNEAGEVVLFNAEAERVLWYHRSEVLGHPVEMLVPDAAKGRHVSHRQSYGDDLHTRPMGALAARRKDGKEIAASIFLSSLITPGGVFFMAIIRPTSHER